MSTLPLLSEYELRTERAERVKAADDVALPELKYWNYTACAAHDEPQVDCKYKACGGELFSHQRVGVSWLYIRKSGLLADLPGVGKTNQILGLAALLKERGELGRMLVVCQTPSVLQWFAEANRWTPKLRSDCVYSGLTRPKRIDKYVQSWDMMIVGSHMMLQDWQMFENLEIDTLVIDDVDPLLNHETQTHQRLVALSQNAERVIVMNATAIQTKLQQVHAALLPAGGFDVFGSLSGFENRYVRSEKVRTISEKGYVRDKKIDVGYKNGAELKAKLGPMVLRRRYEDLTDVRMPTLMPPKYVWLDMHPAQAKKYKELQAEVLKIKKADGTTKVKHVTALTAVTYGQQICAGLPAMGEADHSQASIKLDWVMKAVTEAWPDRKVVLFIKNIGLIKALHARLDAAGVGYATIWGEQRNAKVRAAEIDRFWKDPNCRVMMGTQAIERSLNLKIANILVNVDTVLNPARMTQIAGRIRRAGSSHDHIWVFSLFCTGTQEERYLDVLRRRQGLADYAWDDESELYEKLSPMELLSLITP